jgi:hypothetical protein
MKTYMKSDFIVGMIFLCGLLCFSAERAWAGSAAGIKVVSQVKGRIEMLEKSTAFLSVGDFVLVTLNKPSSAMPGDKMEIYEPVKTEKTDESGSPILMHVGRLALTDIGEGRIIGVVEFALHEIMSGSYVDFSLPEESWAEGLSDYLSLALERHASHKAGDIAAGTLGVAFADVTNDAGDITRLDEEVYEKLSASICARSQLSCVSRGSLTGFMRANGISTTANPGRYFLEKIGREFKADIMITATASQEAGAIAITFRTYSLKDGSQDPDFKITLHDVGYSTDKAEGGILVKNTNKSTSILKIVLNKSSRLNGKRVENLFVESLDAHVPEKYAEFIPDLVLKVSMELDDRPLEPLGKTGEYYSDLISGGTHSLTITVVPSIPGKPGVNMGKKISKTVALNIQPEFATETEVDVKTLGKQIIIAVDSNQMEKQSPTPTDIR